MRRNSYAVWWKEEHGPRHVGKLEVALFHALLSGNGSKRLAVPLDAITDRGVPRWRSAREPA